MQDGQVKLAKYQTYIDGKWCDAATGKRFQSYNPYTAEAWAEIPDCTAEDVGRAVDAAHRAFTTGPWPGMTQTARGKLLRRIADLAEKNAEYLAGIEVKDNGKLISEMLIQCKYLVEWYNYFGGLADKITGSIVPIDKPDHFTYTLREPLGVCAFILPWNSPLLLVAYKLAPALATGNTVVIKPSEFTSASTLEFVRLVLEPAGVPPGVVNVITGSGAVVGEPLVTHPKVAKVAFTGGSATGARVNELAARTFKKVSLELGGKSPNIVFDDAVIDDAVNGAVSGIFAATGQTCIAGSRLLLQESIHDQFMEKLITLAKTARLGDPSKFETQVGPVTTPPQYQKILGYIDIAKGRGRQVRARRRAGNGGGGRWHVFRQADNFHRRQQQDAHRAGGSVRTSAVGHSLQGRSACHRDRQRRDLRPRLGRVDAEHQSRVALCKKHQGRHGMGQYLPRGVAADAFRRLQIVGARSRERRVGDR